jgi:hypothetical protein
MEPPAASTDLDLFTPDLPPMQLCAFSIDDRHHLLRFLPLALSASGAWLLRHEVTSGLIRFIFEFERSNGMNIYGMLVGIGLELTRSSHAVLTSFCERTLNLSSAGACQVATCELEICELLEDTASTEPLFGSTSTT